MLWPFPVVRPPTRFPFQSNRRGGGVLSWKPLLLIAISTVDPERSTTSETTPDLCGTVQHFPWKALLPVLESVFETPNSFLCGIQSEHANPPPNHQNSPAPDNLRIECSILYADAVPPIVSTILPSKCSVHPASSLPALGPATQQSRSR